LLLFVIFVISLTLIQYSKEVSLGLTIERLQKNDPTPHTLRLNDNNIGVEGANCVANALATNSTLQVLKLNYNNIGVEGLLKVQSALQMHLQRTPHCSC